jgi:hypothetical protein
VNWRWLRRAAYLAAAVMILLPIVTFTMAYFIVDIPKPGNIRRRFGDRQNCSAGR